jgi:flagellar biosynthesis/type III secretory pathway protein FliH
MPEGGYESDAMPPPPSMPGEYRDFARGSAPSREVSAELAEGLESMRRAVIEARREILESSEQELVRLALVIAEKVVGRELTIDAEAVAGWAREGIDALGAADDATCVVSPKVADVLMSTDHWKHGLTAVPEVIVDARLSGFRCDVRGKFGRVETGIRERIAAVAEALGTETPT